MSRNCQAAEVRPFDFARDTFAFANETYWEYHFDKATGAMSFTPHEPKPTYAHRCFVLTRAARQFLYHARFDPEKPALDDASYRRLIGQVVWRNPRQRCAPEMRLVFPGYASLREFSTTHGPLLKGGCGGAWRSYVLRSHWRMVFPISREHQADTAASLAAALKENIPPIVHLVKFPALTINHSLLLYDFAESAGSIEFQAYDPNNPKEPTKLIFDRATSTFSLPPNHYWNGSTLDVIEVYRSWLF
jgi:hypothetical protein